MNRLSRVVFMVHLYPQRFHLIIETVQSSEMRSLACLFNSQSFTRKRKMPLKDLLLCTFSKKGLTTTIEHYLSISKQVFLNSV